MTATGADRAVSRGRIPGMRRKREEPDLVAAFVARGLAVVPAAAPLGPGCSCSRVGCPDPGAHPLSYGWQTEASADPAQLRRWRSRLPDVNFASPTGRTHDVLDVPIGAGRIAFRSLTAAGVQLGPVAVSAQGDRCLFFTTARPGGQEERAGDEWWHCDLDAAPETGLGGPGLRWHTRGSYVLVPPARALNGGRARWIHALDAPLPDPLRLLGALADACEAVAATGEIAQW
ncbi:bifunctional DNA primase/polymerase [Actinocrinis puniceicyclus]|uniref:Bifunctional DNA primase/polymerase n=1 Tax=Actinocrinis puniceicyclus TaxID=977794 RepID=A0A8J7WRS2_9ACTN|nr:bifunctional DNA primase/polymerase [Actinocrinis puniceicyclus]MBS2964204.1 bifunctional DNA primase/polymerase [Actinocrinis puniceicyclus]